ncbi:MAG: ABC transporter transmembrane domain-containing protein [Promethearchaeota archaeon]
MYNNQEDKDQEEQKEIIQPSASTRRRFMFDDEKAKLEYPRKKLWKWLFSYIKSSQRKFSLYFIFLLLGTVLSSVTPLLSASIIDKGIVGRNSDYILIMSTFYLLLMILMAISNYISQFGMGKISQRITFEIRNDIFFKLQEMSLSYFDKRSSGEIISIATNDVTILNQLVGGQFVQIITSFVSIVLTVVFMYILNPFLALISMIIFPLFLITTYIFRKIATKLFKESRKAIGKVTASIQENIEGAKVVQAYGQETRASSEFDKANIANYNANVKIRRYMATMFPLITLITTILTAGILLIGGFTILGNVVIFGVPVSVGVLSAYISILSQFFRPFMMLMQTQQVIEAAMAASDRIYSILEAEAEIPEYSSPKVFSDVNGSIEFRAVSFGYKFKNNRIVDKKPLETSMMNQVIKAIKSFPEPYSSFILDNMKFMSNNIRQKLFTNLMGSEPTEIPEKIDKVLAEFQYAVPNTVMASKHSEYKNSFKLKTLKENFKETKDFTFEQIVSPETVLMMVKFLEEALRTTTGMQQNNTRMGESRNLIGGDTSLISSSTIKRMLASIEISPEVQKEIPKVVLNAIREQKKIIQHEQSMGYVLRNVDLKLSSGKTLAIVGETGAGKTSLIKLIARFYDINDGKILIDGIDIREVRKEDLRNLIGLVPQDAFIFTGTIKENILYAFEDITPELEQRMIEISKFLGLHNFIETLYKDYNTKLKENGSNISIGQRQLIAFARALITNPKILILDEATSSVDPYTETLIQDALNKARKGRTTIIIAHRLSTIKNADHIIVLSADKKGIVEQGAHETLLSLNGKYKRLLEMQHRDIDISN